ncbi:TldD/PmbA family protein [Saccharolobus solfataricus]|uniref:Zinc metalloprotease TldD homolog n=3 Tax=Saccharolobus solfataricus TaxID=2287 RepID=TLDD_SACS2|nr:zinc metalloprotease TldD [Saccharolobus solfataricus]Q7LXP6.1 RecName: Full=Zinc metalloprotease TldD homolog [Saccharolobus solfataricus P2]AAK40965.1 Zn-dependent protease, tldD protein homolog, putative (tldD) [Saccharolobus solfataricus P2]AKA73993.1 TldD/PmbA family protein [Saccharolobus solfataricus]AKA76690.1 TldD/PmbA family protein [Saccharolobus solfataricus]AKA79384.1 TldD/PmbA family protein [Saccharolobus solfataricus]AZF68471.1 TldD/PmbA family protein [Saccharolobus solfat
MFKYIKKAEELGASFADIRYERVIANEVTITEDRKYVSHGVDEGYSIRVIYNRNWGFKATDKITENEIEDTINHIYGDERVNIVYLPSKHDTIKIGKDINKNEEEKINDLHKVASQVNTLHPSIKSYSIKYYDEIFHKEYYSSEDREIIADGSSSSLSILVVAREGDVTVEVSEILSTQMGYIFDVFDINQVLANLQKRIINQLKGSTPKAGEYPVILAPEVVGIFTHEAIGHLSEADVTLNGSLYKLRNKRIGDEFLNISDLPAMDHPQSSLVYYDDEGVEGREVKIIENGILKEFMTDRYYSAYLGQPPTGNARAQSYRNFSLIRMRNTYMKPGDASLNELFEGIKEGYYLVSPIGGETSSNGTFQFAIQEGYRVENSEIKEPLRNIGISGNTISTLNAIEMISKDFGMSSGFCEKNGQTVQVSNGGPHIKVKKLKVGGYV